MTMKPSAWLERIDAAEDRGEFNEEDDKLSGNWRQCAVGELLDGINIGTSNVLSLAHQIDLRLAPPEDGNTMPQYRNDRDVTTMSLIRLGEEFAGTVYSGSKKFGRAREIVKEIRRRGHAFGLEHMR